MARRLTTGCGAGLLRPVKRLSRLLALLLLALWLPATLHCDLEAASLWDGHEDHPAAACCSAGQGCAHDGCDTLEGGAFRASDGTVRAPLPDLFCCFCLICTGTPALLEPVATTPVPTIAVTARDWIPTWHFVRRTAPPSRAPSSASC